MSIKSNTLEGKAMKKRMVASKVSGGTYFRVLLNGKVQPSQWGRSVPDVRRFYQETYGEKCRVSVIPMLHK